MQGMHHLGFTPAARFLLVAGAFVVVVAGLKAASNLVTPFLLAVFIAVLVVPPLQYMRNHGLPTWAAMLVVVAVLLSAGGGIVALFSGSLSDFNASLPGYHERLTGLTGELDAWLDTIGIHVSRQTINSIIDPARIFRMTTELIRGLGGVLTNAFLILLTVIFILIEANSLPSKLRAALRRPEASLDHLREVMHTINRYMFLKACTSAFTGVALWAWLAFLGVDFAAMWGFLAFLLNFVPTIGSIIAAVPAVMLALVQLGIDDALLAMIGFMIVNVAVGNFLEPRIMGQGLGLSTLVVFLSLIFWGWVLGPAGMFLSVPLTMALKIAFGANPQTYPIAVLLGPAEEARALMAMGRHNDMPLTAPRMGQSADAADGRARAGAEDT
jgi:predicted PurR-regulated permease PerM